MTIFFTSDLHIGHLLVSKLRGFYKKDQDGVKVGDPDGHDQALADAWDSVVTEKDTVYILGDMSINSGPQVIEWIRARPGKKHLISGNHDKTHSGIYSKYSKAKIEEWSPYFVSIQDERKIEIGGKIVTLSHFPSWSWGDGPGRDIPARYEKFRPWVKDDTIILHGHTHGVEREHGREYHVGVDAHGLVPVSIDEIKVWIESLE